MHISFTNKKRIEINKLMMNKIILENPDENVIEFKKLYYDDNSQDVKIIKGMPIIARRNCKELNIANNDCFTIKEINHEEKLIIIGDEQDEGEIKIEFKNFQQYFYVAYCITCYKVQGMTYDEQYTIHEWEKYNEEMKYVSLSRATNKDLINII
jgi:ATP-dependent exoDNAse (exonuclease V) alpha subunit